MSRQSANGNGARGSNLLPRKFFQRHECAPDLATVLPLPLSASRRRAPLPPHSLLLPSRVKQPLPIHVLLSGDVKAPPLQAKPTKAYMAKRKGEQKALKAQKAAEAGEPATRDVSALEQKKCWAKVGRRKMPYVAGMGGG